MRSIIHVREHIGIDHAQSTGCETDDAA